jgi:hypothetical protein
VNDAQGAKTNNKKTDILNGLRVHVNTHRAAQLLGEL